jgi:transcriptional regulator with XRE-family HTH domain
MAKRSVALQVGKAIRARRERAGFSQDAFADKIEMHRAYYAAIERGEKNVTLSTLKRVADGLGVTMADLLREAGA